MHFIFHEYCNGMSGGINHFEAKLIEGTEEDKEKVLQNMVEVGLVPAPMRITFRPADLQKLRGIVSTETTMGQSPLCSRDIEWTVAITFKV